MNGKPSVMNGNIHCNEWEIPSVVHGKPSVNNGDTQINEWKIHSVMNGNTQYDK